jgi:hypothetical protein
LQGQQNRRKTGFQSDHSSSIIEIFATVDYESDAARAKREPGCPRHH